MRPDLQREDRDGLIRRHDELTRAARTLQRPKDAAEEPRGTPFDLMVDVAKNLLTMFVIATVALVLVAVALQDLPVSIP